MLSLFQTNFDVREEEKRDKIEVTLGDYIKNIGEGNFNNIY